MFVFMCVCVGGCSGFLVFVCEIEEDWGKKDAYSMTKIKSVFFKVQDHWNSSVLPIIEIAVVISSNFINFSLIHICHINVGQQSFQGQNH